MPLIQWYTAPMTNHVFSLFVPTFLLSALFCVQASAQTVSDAGMIQARISKPDLVHMDHIRSYFKNDPVFRFECFQPEKAPKNDARARQVFHEYAADSEQGQVQIKLKESRLGFDLEMTKTQDHKHRELYQGTQSLECVLDGGDHCSALAYDDERQFQIKTTEQNLDPSAQKKESWRLTFKNGELFAKREVDFEIVERSWLGQKSGSIRFSKPQLCALFPEK